MKSASPTTAGTASLAGPSSFYRSECWGLGLRVARALPRPWANLLCYIGATAYSTGAPRRHETVVQNLLPLCDGNHALAKRVASSVFREMAFKVADLWRLEGGASLDAWSFTLDGWDIYATARDRRQGVLMVTPHVGNWEMGGPLLAREGVKLVVVTQAEPGQGLTELRQSWRARWGIETVVIGQDEFAFVEIIKRLMEGTTVALLIDRPPAASAVTVELFGRPFQASVAAAELVRASGCALLGVYVVRQPGGYCAVVMPEFTYDRRALGERAQRQALTQQILRAFEPVIRQHRDQWFHFMPIWPEASR